MVIDGQQLGGGLAPPGAPRGSLAHYIIISRDFLINATRVHESNFSATGHSGMFHFKLEAATGEWKRRRRKGQVREGEEGALVRRSHSPAATARFFAQTGRKNVQVQRDLHKVKTVSSMWFQWYRLQFRIDLHQQRGHLCGTFARLQKNKANIRVRLKRLFSILARQACGTRDRDHDNDPLSVPLLAAGRNCRGRIASIPSEHGRRESP
jgi:hypothetical protein